MSRALRDWYVALRALENEARAARQRPNIRRETERALAKPPYGVHLRAQRLSNWIPDDPDETPPQLPQDFDLVWALVRLWSDWAGRQRPKRAYWSGLLEAARPGRGRSPRAAAEDADWPQLIQTHLVWNCVNPDYSSQVEAFKQQATQVARQLARVHDRSADAYADPWRDPQFARRFTRETQRVLSACLPRREKIFTPAEAAMLALIPLLHHTHKVWSAAKWSHIDPLNLQPLEADDVIRREYQKFYHQARYEWLVRRAKSGELPGRKWSGKEIAGWLYRRWLEEPLMAENCSSATLLAEAEVTGGDMGALLNEDRVAIVLRALRLDPDRLTSDDQRLSWLQRHDAQYFESCQSLQEVRQRLICLILATARAMTVDIVDLPVVVVEHLGIPDPAVNLDDLRTTLTGASWEPSGKRGIRLKAACSHEAVLAALREYTQDVDALLRVVHRALGEGDETLDKLAHLWTNADADGVQPARRAGDGRKLFEPELIRFRLDERRVRELLMGENLYGDSALAIRELYQNALDACRLRQAYELEHSRIYNRSFDYSGLIEFRQDRDEHGRYFLECRDNGVGMGERELREVFSQAGVRFTEQRSFWEDQARWKTLDPPVEMYPNSRFGIGVFSYFMLADEIEVKTRRMDRDGGKPGPEYTVVISGPGHLFHINKTPPMGDGPGTRVRLYLRDPNAPSCVTELRRLLGVADFLTTAVHGDQAQKWEPGRLQRRRRMPPEHVGLNVYGALIPWLEEGQEAPIVWWCEHGGALLVDGLLVRPGPAARRGVLAEPEGNDVRGVVVNLTGKRAPRLSVDRMQVLGEVSPDIEELITAAAATFAASNKNLPSFHWISSVASESPKIADIVTQAAIAAGRPLKLNGRDMDTAVTGCFPQDAALINEDKFDRIFPGARLMTTLPGHPPDHLLLWRFLAHRADDEQGILASFVPELNDIGPVLAAAPSDMGLLADVWRYIRGWPDIRQGESPGRIIWTAMNAGISPRRAASRAAAIGLDWLRPELFSEQLEPDPIELALLSDDLTGEPSWRSRHWPVPPGHIVGARYRLNIEVVEAAERLHHYDFDVPDVGQMPKPKPADLVLLSMQRNAGGLWLKIAQPVPIGHILSAALDLDTPAFEIIERLVAYGMNAEWKPTLKIADTDDLRLLSARINSDAPWLDHTKPVPPGHLIYAAMLLGLPLAKMASCYAGMGLMLPSTLPTGRTVDDRTWSVDRSLLSRYLNGQWPWLDAEQPVPARHLILARRVLKISIPEAAERLASYGLSIPRDIPVDTPYDLDPELLSQRLDGILPWLDADDPVPLRHLVRAARNLPLTLAETAARLRELGMNVPDLATTIRAALDKVPRHPSC